jgi:hypothetical protein
MNERKTKFESLSAKRLKGQALNPSSPSFDANAFEKKKKKKTNE